ncbi:uncharacterized protein LOC113216661 [Frankliniella occidentalis]|uniref:Uncharacterized protein LOC113216661 n=1 Tax=Frankliniella occidentalis TaxID=133901 RepID=A0A6J1TKL5_FRAOC|nr:uncharacterized protein LOC113216661 [Frankliniella occidentalis]
MPHVTGSMLLLLGCFVWLLPAEARLCPWAGPPSSEGVVELLLDVDAGADDAMAILELLAAEQLSDPSLTPTRVVAISCVGGNAPVRLVRRNVMATLEAAGRLDIPVFLGAHVSLLHENPTATMYGRDGFGDFLPDQVAADEPGDVHAVLALTRMVRENPGRFTLLALAPLTNVALALRLDPSFLDNMRAVYFNGAAAHGGGNQGQPGKEINVNFDPEAAFIVYNSTRKAINVMPSETASDLRVSRAWRVGVLGAVDSAQVRLLNRAERVVLEAAGDKDPWVNANGLLAAALLCPCVVRERNPGRLLVATADGVARGATFVDFSGAGGPDNVLVLERPDSSLFRALALRLLSTPPPQSGPAAVPEKGLFL